MLFLVPVICFSFLRPVLAALRNVTIDDTYGDPDTGVQFTYAPAGNWSLGQNCTNCEAHPDPAYTYDKSWHDTTFFPSLDTAPPNASVSFNGSAIYVYCIVFHTTSYPNSYMDLRFLIDGEETGNFSQIPTGSTEIDYNHLVYKNLSIPHGVHTFTLVSGQPGGQAALVLLDYMTYTTETDETTATTYVNHTSKPTRAIAIAVSICGVVLLASALAGFIYRRHRRRHDLTLHAQPYMWISINSAVMRPSPSTVTTDGSERHHHKTGCHQLHPPNTHVSQICSRCREATADRAQAQGVMAPLDLIPARDAMNGAQIDNHASMSHVEEHPSLDFPAFTSSLQAQSNDESGAPRRRTPPLPPPPPPPPPYSA